MATLVVVPIDPEFEAMAAVLGEMGYAGEERAVGRLTATEFADGRLIVARGGLGKTQFGVQTRHLLDNLDGVDAVICAGTSGALAESVNKFDVVVATETIEHDFNRGNTLIVLPLPTYAGDARAHRRRAGVGGVRAIPVWAALRRRGERRRGHSRAPSGRARCARLRAARWRSHGRARAALGRRSCRASRSWSCAAYPTAPARRRWRSSGRTSRRRCGA